MVPRAPVRVPGLCATLVVSGLIAVVAMGVHAGGDLAVTQTLPYRVASAQPKPELEVLMLNLLNQERIQRQLPTFVAHAGLRAAARAHGQEMFAYGFLSHRSRDGRTLSQRISSRHLRVGTVGENLAHAPDVRTAHAELMASDSHRLNILLPQFGLVGIAVLDGGVYGVIVVQNFSQPIPLQHAAGQARQPRE